MARHGRRTSCTSSRSPVRCRRTAAAHFALRVDDLDDAVAELRAQGIKVDPIPEAPGAGRQAFLTDPAGNLIELNQPTGPVP